MVGRGRTEADRKQIDKLTKMTKYNFMFKLEEQKAVDEL